MKNTNIAVKEVSIENLFKWWIEITKPLHKLSKKHSSVIEALLIEHYNLKQKVKDSDLVDDFLFSTAVRKKVMDRCKLSTYPFNNAISQLRMSGHIIGNKINPRLVPNISNDAKDYRIIFQFKING